MDLDDFKLWLNSTKLRKGKAYTNKDFWRNELLWMSMVLLLITFLGFSASISTVLESRAICHSAIPEGYHFVDYSTVNKTCTFANSTKVIIAGYIFDPVEQRYLIYGMH